jgi:peroxiredoxin
MVLENICRKSSLCVLLFGVLFTAVATAGCNASPRTGTGPGDLAPDIKGTDMQGKAVSLQAVRGEKLTLVNFWATWCGPCITELPALQKLHEQMQKDGIRVVGVVLDDSPESVAEYTNKYKLSYQMIFDSEGASKRPYEINGLPESFILDNEGRIVMLPDPGNGQLVTKLIGPRQWESPAVQSLFTSLVRKK